MAGDKTDNVISHNPWQGLNRLAFCENAILLELKGQSQGQLHRSRSNDSAPVAQSWTDQQSLRNFLDDMALIAAGSGGKDNVAAASLEWETANTVCLRVARNEGFGDDSCEQLQDLLNRSMHPSLRGNGTPNALSSYATVAEVKPSSPDDSALELIVLQCQPRLEKHTSRLLGQLRHAQCRPVGKCCPPSYRPGATVRESKENVQTLGLYSAHTHSQYMDHVAGQLDELRSLCNKVENNSTMGPQSSLCRITTLAYQCRGSGALRLYLKENLCMQTRAGFLDTVADEIIERIGKLARFYRARKTITTFTAWLANAGVNIRVRGLPSCRIQVEELNDRTVSDVRARGGPNLAPYPKTQIYSKIQRWPRYRVHSEVQLAIFYEEHSNLETVGNYIGGDKLCCYLCHEFLVRHGRFQTNGCHQSLYSLWMVPNLVIFSSLERASLFHQALEGVCTLLENQVSKLRRGPRLRRRLASQNESCANISRISLLSFTGQALTSFSTHQLPTSVEVVEVVSPSPEYPSAPHVETIQASSPPPSLVAVDVVPPSPGPLPQWNELEDAEYASVSHVESIQASSPPPSLVVAEVFSPLPDPSPQCKDLKDAEYPSVSHIENIQASSPSASLVVAEVVSPLPDPSPQCKDLKDVEYPRVSHIKNIQASSPDTQPQCKDLEDAAYPSVLHVENIQASLPPPSLVTVDVQDLDSPTPGPSEPEQSIRDSQAPKSESIGNSQTGAIRRTSWAEAPELYQSRRRRRSVAHEGHKRPVHREKNKMADPKRAGHHRHRHGYRRSHHRRRPEEQPRRYSSDEQSQIYSSEKPRGPRRQRRKTWSFTRLVTDILRRLCCYR